MAVGIRLFSALITSAMRAVALLVLVVVALPLYGCGEGYYCSIGGWHFVCSAAVVRGIYCLLAVTITIAYIRFAVDGLPCSVHCSLCFLCSSYLLLAASLELGLVLGWMFSHCSG